MFSLKTTDLQLLLFPLAFPLRPLHFTMGFRIFNAMLLNTLTKLCSKFCTMLAIGFARAENFKSLRVEKEYQKVDCMSSIIETGSEVTFLSATTQDH